MDDGERFIGLATLVLAVATVWLGLQAKRQAQDAREAERSRRAEISQTTADPLALWLDGTTTMDPDRWPVLQLRIKNTGSRYVAAITVTMRAEGVNFAQSAGRDALVPGQEIPFEIPLREFLQRDNEDGRNLRPIKSTVFVDVESYGLVGQRVYQTFTCRLDRIVGGQPGPRWYQSRLQITPAEPGVHSTDVTFRAE